MDPKMLNQVLRRSHYQTVTVDELLPQLSAAKVFSVCDVKNGFWHLVFYEESSYLTTFGTLLGWYRWLRRPFGISPHRNCSNAI